MVGAAQRRALGVGLFAAALACSSEPGPVASEPCPADTIATPAGCLPVRGRPSGDAGAADGGAPDAAGPDAAADAGLAPTDAGLEDAGGPDAGPPAVELSGTWALVVRSAQAVSTPLVGPETVVFEWRSLVRISQRDLQLEIGEELCALEAGPFSGTETSWPAAALEAVTLQGPPATLDAALPGARFVASDLVRLGGWQPDVDAIEEALPTDPDDARVRDGDGDQQPGLTLEVTGALEGQIYVAMRDVTSLLGVVVSADRVEGRSEVRRQRENLAASNEIFTAGDPTYEAVPDDETNTFVLVRLGDFAGCADVLNAQ